MKMHVQDFQKEMSKSKCHFHSIQFTKIFRDVQAIIEIIEQYPLNGHHLYK